MTLSRACCNNTFPRLLLVSIHQPDLAEHDVETSAAKQPYT